MGWKESAAGGQQSEGPVAIGAAGTPIKKVLSATAVLDFPSIAGTGVTADLTVAVPGALVGDSVVLGPPTTLNAGVIPYGFVSASDVVTIRCTNCTGGALDPASATWRVDVIQH